MRQEGEERGRGVRELQGLSRFIFISFSFLSVEFFLAGTSPITSGVASDAVAVAVFVSVAAGVLAAAAAAVLLLLLLLML